MTYNTSETVFYTNDCDTWYYVVSRVALSATQCRLHAAVPPAPAMLMMPRTGRGKLSPLQSSSVQFVHDTSVTATTIINNTVTSY